MQVLTETKPNQREEIIFRSKLPDIYIPKHLLLHEYIFQNISDVATQPCLINGGTGETFTYKEVQLAARKIASGIRTLGIDQRDVIMILLPNCPEFVLFLLGASYGGAIATAANPFFTPAEISKQAKASGAKLIVTQACYAEKVKDLNRNDGVLVMCVDSTESVPDWCLRFTELTRSTETKLTRSGKNELTQSTQAELTQSTETELAQSIKTELTRSTETGSTQCTDADSTQCTDTELTQSTNTEATQSTEVDSTQSTKTELPQSIETESAQRVEITPDDVVLMPYSSGTTGFPKGVMLTHKGMVTSVAQQVDGENPNLYLRKNDVVLYVLPMFHVYAMNPVLLCSLRVGAAILIMAKFEIGTMLELIQRYRVTVAPIVPPIVLAIAKSEETEKYDLSSVRVLKSGAAPLGKELEEAVSVKFPNAKLGQGYGMTEAGPVLAMSLAFAKEPMKVKSGACGTVVRNAEMKIVDPQTGVSLPRNQSGEICIRGHQIMKGYLNDPDATAKAIDGEGWLHTGDIGYVDDDEELFIVDRLKEIIKYKGFQVAPAELEALLIAHPNITDAAVIGMENEAAGEVPVAFVVTSGGSQITEDEIKKYVSNQVIYYKRIYKVFFIDAIPKAPSGKILRKDLRAKLG